MQVSESYNMTQEELEKGKRVFTREELTRLILFDEPHYFPSGFTQKELIRLVKINFPNLTGFEFGQCNPSVYTVSGGKRFYVYDSLSVLQHIESLLFKNN